MQEEIERTVIQETGDEGYFKDVVAREDLVETKRIVEEIDNTTELTLEEINNIYSRLLGEIFN